MKRSKRTADQILSGLIPTAFSIIAALLIGTIVLIFSGIHPLQAYSALFYGAFGNLTYFADTLGRATPVIFTGLAMCTAFRGGMFNIGAEGQLTAGAICAAIAGYALPLNGLMHLLFTILAGMAGGALWALIPALLKAKKGVHEVISTIMMNYAAINVGGFIIERLRRDELPKTPEISDSAVLIRIKELIPAVGNSNLNMGFVLALISAVIIYVIIDRTVMGYELRAMGFSAAAAEDAGINIKKKIVLIMLMSGMLAGLAGTERVLGVHHTYLSGISTNFGFEGIAVALLAGNHPILIIFSALLFGALSSGGQYMNLAADVPVDIVGIIQGLLILFAAISQTSRYFNITKLFRRKEAAVS